MSLLAYRLLSGLCSVPKQEECRCVVLGLSPLPSFCSISLNLAQRE